MTMAEEKKQMKSSDMENRLNVVRDKVAFLRRAIQPDGADEGFSMTHEEAEGLGWILDEFTGELRDMSEAEIIEHRASEPLPLRKEA
jgi:hypothetical protein